MLHRISMRVIPALTLAVTEDAFRKRKRILMLFPGLLAFVLYKGLHLAGHHDDILALLLASGLYSMLVALAAYSYGRERRLIDLAAQDGGRHLIWFGLRFGFLYGVQLSLMVLALLKVFWYSYTEHPDGPAMMALIIASTSVCRDAFELGHLRLLREQGRPFLTCPDAKGGWALLAGREGLWPLTLAIAAGVMYFGLAIAVPALQTDLGHLLIIGLLAGLTGTAAYLKGLRPTSSLWHSLTHYSSAELGRFFLWPGVTFGWTYVLILIGVTSFIIVVPIPALAWRVVVTVFTTGLVSLYCYYMGQCRQQEEKRHATISPSMLRCPFILGILNSKKV